MEEITPTKVTELSSAWASEMAVQRVSLISPVLWRIIQYSCSHFTARFADYILKDSRSHGMLLRYSFPPHPVGFIPRSHLKDYIKETYTGKPLMQEIIDA